MPVNKHAYQQIAAALGLKHVKLVAVSKKKSVGDIYELYKLGQRDFGENYVQELAEKHLVLPHDIHWHFIGHLQTNKVKYIAPFVHLIHSVDSFKLLTEINRQGMKYHRIIECLLQVHIAQEETKFGLSEAELDELVSDLKKLDATDQLHFVRITGLMGMASFTGDTQKIRSEFKYLSSLYDKYSQFITTNFHLRTLSMGMSADYKIAIEEGSNLVRIGSLLFGERI
ncbi:MAG TPA: YggS family pyridoxal phosphate-dependent enzyme [Chitinophagaceae bacterium]|nr:YggS family pyridoxal phosphate-dependent enzyme [Chitinophagaceae bacterium]